MSLGKHSLVSSFMHGTRRLRPFYLVTVPSWDLSAVLDGLSGSFVEPMCYGVSDSDRWLVEIRIDFNAADGKMVKTRKQFRKISVHENNWMIIEFTVLQEMEEIVEERFTQGCTQPRCSQSVSY